MSADKLLSWDAARDFVKVRQDSGQTVVFTNGCFDILHPGHVSYLREAKALGDVLVVGLNSDASVKRLKGETRPIMDENDRAIMLGALEMIDAVVLFEEDTPIDLLGHLGVDIHVKGGDYSPDTLPEADVVKRMGGRVEILRFVDGKSTSDVIATVLERLS